MRGGQKKYSSGQRHRPETIQRARNLRRQGRSFKEIAKELVVSSSSSYAWTSGIKLSREQIIEMYERKKRKAHRWSPTERKKIGRMLRPYQFKKRHTKASLIKLIRDFYNENGRIPMKREFKSVKACRIYFGSWNKAIIAAGFEPNPVYFTKRARANDGHMCDSTIERLVDDWLFRHGIPHERNRYYPDSKMTADFYIQKCEVWIELFGLKGAHKNYDRKHKRKLDIAHRKKLNFIALYTTDVLNQDLVTKLGSLIHNQT